MNPKVIIFDFDGTIADTVSALVRITNNLASEFGYQQTDQEELAQLRNLSSRQIIERSGISIFKLPFLARKVKLELNKEIRKLSPFPRISEAIIQLKNQDNILGIITSNSQENVTAFLETHALQDLFSFIYAGRTLFGKNKVITKLIKQENLDPEAVIYVGDEVRDIEAARKSQIKMIAVTWGFNSREVLAEYRPDSLIDSPDKLIEAVEMKINNNL